MNTNSNRKYQGLSYAVDEFITSFLTGDSETGYKGAYTTHVDSIKSQNDRLDDRIEDLEYYLEQREENAQGRFYADGGNAIKDKYSDANLAKLLQ